MTKFNNYLNEEQIIESIDFELYCQLISPDIDENFLRNLKDKGMEFLLKVFKPIKDTLLKIAGDFKVGISEVVSAFRERSIFNFLKAVRFNIGVLLRSIGEVGKLVRQGLMKVFEEISKSGVIQQLRKGTLKIDQFLDQYPLLKRIGGIAVAGLLLYI